MAKDRGKKPREDLDIKISMGIAKVIAKAWQSDEFKQRFLANPVKVLTEEGVPVPQDVSVKVVLDEEHLRHIVVPVKPRGMGEAESRGLEWCSHMWCTGRR